MKNLRKIARITVLLLSAGALFLAAAHYGGPSCIQNFAWADPVIDRIEPETIPDKRLAKLPEPPLIKDQRQQKTSVPKPAETDLIENPITPKKSNNRTFSKSPLDPLLWGAKGNGFTDDYGALKAIIAAIGARQATIIFHTGTYKIGHDLTFPANIDLVFMNGAMLAPGRMAGKGLLTYTPTAAPETITSKGTLVTLSGGASNSNLRAGMYIVAGGQRKKIREVGPDYRWFETWTPFKPGLSGASYTYSNIKVNCSEAHELQYGEFLYVNGQTLVNRNKDTSNPTQFYTRGYPSAGFNAARWERGVQVIILGSMQAGLYQICTGDGNLKFGRGALRFARPEWWGAKADSASGPQATLNSAAIDKALNCHYGDYRIPVQFAAGSYRVASEIWLDDSVHLIGAGDDGFLRGGTVISAAYKTFHVIQDVPNRGYSDKRLEHLTIIAGRDYPCNGLNATHNLRNLWVYDCTFYGCGGYGIYTNNWGIGEIAHCKITGCVGGFYLNAYDMKVHDNEIQTAWSSDQASRSMALGYLLATSSDRDNWTGWTKGWIWSAKRATHKEKGGTGPLAQKFSTTLWKNWTYRLIFKVTGGTRGTVTPYVGGIAGKPVPFNGGYSDQIFTMATTLTDPTIEFHPTNDFDGSIDCSGATPKPNAFKEGIILRRTGDGILLASSNSLVSGNIIYGDGYTCSGIRLAGSSTNVISNNRFDSCYYNIFFDHGGGIVSNNNIIGDAVTPKTIANIYGVVSSSAIIQNNRIANNVNKFKAWGVYFTTDCGNCVVSNNEFNRIDANYLISYNTTPKPGDYPLIEDNYGIDLQCPWPILPHDTTSPKIAISKRWQTQNKTPKQIVDFSQGCNGKEIIVVFGDSNTTLKFDGNSKLKGHGGVDWKPVTGDHLRAVKKDDHWYCECFDNSKKYQMKMFER